MHPWPLVVLVGGGVGMLTGFFGVGGSSVATPILALLGVPAFVALASPLPATIPAAALAGSSYLRSGEARRRAAAWSLVGAIPGAMAGALASRRVGGRFLLVASGVMLVVVGARVLFPLDKASRDAGGRRRTNRPLLVASSASVGLFTGLLANGGGFLLVPLYVLVFGLRMRQAVGTSLVVVAALTVPTLAVHWSLGHIDWAIAGLYAAGAIPASAIAGVLARGVESPRLQRAFGWFLVGFGLLFTASRLVGGS